jgi:hypothetical protein
LGVAELQAGSPLTAIGILPFVCLVYWFYRNVAQVICR